MKDIIYSQEQQDKMLQLVEHAKAVGLRVKVRYDGSFMTLGSDSLSVIYDTKCTHGGLLERFETYDWEGQPKRFRTFEEAKKIIEDFAQSVLTDES